jgi:CheY-like chemotaxis protein/GGDEF domain-containing protein
MSAPRLSVIVVAGDPRDGAFVRRVLEDSGDRVLNAADVPEALAKLAQASVDVALVSLSMPRGDGLALVHHLRALYPSLDVVAMSKPDELEDASSAMALGVLTTLVAPLTGDEIRVAVDRARERRALITERARLSSSLASSARRTALWARAVALLTEGDPVSVARRALALCAGEVAGRAHAFYVADPSQGLLSRIAVEGDGQLLPERIADADFDAPTGDPVSVRSDQLSLELVHQGSPVGRVLVKLSDAVPFDDGVREILGMLAVLAAAAFTAARRTDAVVRGGIRDAETSAHTFAYFGDLASREIERAQRHHRPFALLTLHFHALSGFGERLAQPDLSVLRRATTEAVLSAVRESDVVARVDDDEQYILLPETGRLGALACRRRVLERLRRVPLELASLPAADKQSLEAVFAEVSVGVGVFPVDGHDLGELLKFSRKRSERTRQSDWQKFGLDGAGFWEAVEKLIGASDAAEGAVAGGLGAAANLSAAAVIPIALALIRDAQRERIPGTLYLAGDAELSVQVARQVLSSQEQSLRTWLLGPAHSVRDPAADIRLPLTDARLKTTSMVLWMTERGGYCLLGRREPNGRLAVYHSSDLDLVEGLVNVLQSTYHLQPELR